MTDQTDEDVIESHLSDRAKEYAEDHIGEDIQMGALAVPPVPRDKVKQVVESAEIEDRSSTSREQSSNEDYDDVPDDTFNNPIAGHLYGLTDIALAINHSGDPMLDNSVEEDEDPYCVERETVAELKIARGALFSTFNRELAACAQRLGIDPDEHEDLVKAIRGEVGYSVDVSVDEDWSAASADDPESSMEYTTDTATIMVDGNVERDTDGN